MKWQPLLVTLVLIAALVYLIILILPHVHVS